MYTNEQQPKKKKINWVQLIRDIILAILSAITATDKLIN